VIPSGAVKVPNGGILLSLPEGTDSSLRGWRSHGGATL
jgi:hypothetical protein